MLNVNLYFLEVSEGTEYYIELARGNDCIKGFKSMEADRLEEVLQEIRLCINL